MSDRHGAAPAVMAPSAPARHPLRVRDFRLLFVGEAVSLVGDAFAMIALPWLVLAVSRDPLALGRVMALTGIPRAAFMLVGGALVDRFSPRTVMLVSNALRMLLVSGLAVTALTGTTELWMLYAFGLAFGLADAFFKPAQSAVLPRLLHPDQLPAGNMLVSGAAQLAMSFGPVLAGSVIALVGGAAGAPGAVGAGAPGGAALTAVGAALAVDALSFLASIAALSWMRPQQPAIESEGQPSGGGIRGIAQAIGDGLRFAWSRPSIRDLLLLVIAVQAVVVGPFSVGVPVIIAARHAGGAEIYGLVMSGFGAGSLVGMLAAGALPRPGPARLGPVMLLTASGLGVGLVALALAPVAGLLVPVALGIGAANGWVGIVLMSWLQPRIPPALTGRVMSLVMFAFVAVVPVSAPLAGALLTVDPVGTFVAAGVVMVLVVAAGSTRVSLRRLGHEPLADDGAAPDRLAVAGAQGLVADAQSA
jgi:MFS family permease